MIFERRLTKRFVFSVFLALLALLNSNPMVLAEVEKLSQERLEARQWYQDAKFGVFLHWGIYSWFFVEECENPYTSPIKRTVMLESGQSPWKSKTTIANY